MLPNLLLIQPQNNDKWFIRSYGLETRKREQRAVYQDIFNKPATLLWNYPLEIIRDLPFYTAQKTGTAGNKR
jgi:hypothetical protein